MAAVNSDRSIRCLSLTVCSGSAHALKSSAIVAPDKTKGTNRNLALVLFVRRVLNDFIEARGYQKRLDFSVCYKKFVKLFMMLPKNNHLRLPEVVV